METKSYSTKSDNMSKKHFKKQTTKLLEEIGELNQSDDLIDLLIINIKLRQCLSIENDK